MDTKNLEKQLKLHQEILEKTVRQSSGLIETIISLMVDCFRRGNKVMLCGNGGSAADAQHFAAEIIGRFKLERRALPAIALTTDTSILTALGNDYGFDRIFARQVEGLAQAGDLVVGISTSGNSPNVFAAMEKARELGCRTIGLLGKDGGTIQEQADLALIVPSVDTPRIQEGHLTIIHIICDLVEKRLFSGEG